jgi:hypothetical protein
MTGTTRELPIEHEERKPTEVVAVEMADEHRIDLVGVDPRSFERDERRRAAVDKARMPIRFSEDARLEAPAATERIGVT